MIRILLIEDDTMIASGVWNVKETMAQYEEEAIERWGERAENSIQLWKSYTADQREQVWQS